MGNLEKSSHLQRIRTGGCLCGAVRYQVSGELRGVVNCHCSTCRYHHGTFGAYTKAENAQLKILTEEGLKWYDSGDKIAIRGFCVNCGTNLFWCPLNKDTTSIVAGTLDDPKGLETVAHIFVEDKADFYEIYDSLPQYPQGLNSKKL
jgi:hypothetical protein